MPDIYNRTQKEKDLSDRIWSVWDDWSKSDSPDLLERRRLKELSENRIKPVLSQQFFEGHQALMDQFKIRQQNQRAAVMFLMFFTSFEDGLASAWESRVKDYRAEQRVGDRPPWEFVRGSGIEAIKEQEIWIPKPVRRDPVDGRKVIGAKPIVYPSDANRIAVKGITNFNTFGELTGWKAAEQFGDSQIEGYWQCDVNPCPSCAKLHGKPSYYWRRYAPNGPQLHEYCRCWLAFRRLIFNN